MLYRVLIVALFLLGTVAAQTTRRLILKDGSYQSIQKYEIKGDNVHYLSAERYQWEDIPSSMIDWPATEKYQKDLEHKAAVDKEESDREAENDAPVSEAEARTPEVVTGLRLPDKAGVFALDQISGKAQLVELSQDGTQSVQHTTKYLLLKKVDPLATKNETVELTKAHAKVQLHAGKPVIFIKPDVEVEQTRKKPVDERLQPGDAFRFELVKLDPRKDSRVVVTLKTDIGGETSQAKELIPLVAQLVSGDIWIKLEPKQDLSGGEYALVQTTDDGRIGGYVWDFGVQGVRAENPTPQKKPKH